MDKILGRITESDYDRYFQTIHAQQQDTQEKLSRISEAENNYYMTTKYILDLTNRAHELFESSEVEEKRLLIKLLLSNLMIKDENVVYTVKKPFNVILENAD